MTHDNVPLDTSAGELSPSSGTERTMVGLAAVVLLGAALIIVGKVLPPDEVASQVTTASPAASPQESARPTRSPRLSPTPPSPEEVTSPTLTMEVLTESATFQLEALCSAAREQERATIVLGVLSGAPAGSVFAAVTYDCNASGLAPP